MKKILITGANSYIGVSFENYLKQYGDQYSVDTVDVVDDLWREKDFSAYDVLLHVAGLAHQKETKKNAEMYYKINRDLAAEVAAKAKTDGVKQFVFLSSMSVYGMETGVITKDTVPSPKSNYGKSKLQAEELLNELRDDNFKIAILRPPMVYGKGCKGNFQNMVGIVRRFPFFPQISNERSMIYVNHLGAFLKMCIDDTLEGLFFPQNKEYIKTCEMAEFIADAMGKKLHLSSFFGMCIKLCIPFVGICRKGFGSLIYSDTEDFEFSYCVTENEKSIKNSV